MNILVLGATGMLGHMVADYMESRGYNVFKTARNKMRGYIYYDVLEDCEKLDKIVMECRPNFIINCIGLLNEDAQKDPKKAFLINSFLPYYINDLDTDYPCKLIHISTDCVFSGSKGQYKEDDIPDGTSMYARTKAAGEINNGKNVTLRTSIVGPDLNKDGIGLFNWFMKQEGSCEGYNNVYWSGVTTLELAKVIERIFDTNITGIYHITNNKRISKYELLNLFKKYMEKEIEIIKVDKEFNDKSLVNTATFYDLEIPDYDVMVEDMCKYIKKKRKYKGLI